jgi:hypothetical protein
MIVYIRKERTLGRRVALAGAAVATVLGAWWLAGGAPSRGGSEPSPAAAPAPEAAREPVRTPAEAPTRVNTAAVPAAAAPAPVVQYVGHSKQGQRVTAMLSYQGRSIVLAVPGRLDERYEVVSADERWLVLRDIASATTQRIALGASPPATSSAGAAAAPGSEGLPAVEASAQRATPRKLPPQSKRTSDEDEPEN